MTHFARSILLLAVLALFPGSVALAFGPSGAPRLSGAVAEGGVATASPWIAYTLLGAVYVVRTNGTERHRVTFRENASEPTLSPNGLFVAFVTGSPVNAGSVHTVRVAAVEGASKAGVIVRRIRGDLRSPVWSPDGGQLAFMSRFSIWLWDQTAHTPRRIIPGTKAHPRFSPVWSPDSRYVGASFELSPLKNGRSSTRLGVSVYDVASRTHATEYVAFPSWLAAAKRHFIGGSAPGAVFGWLPDGSLLASTVFLGEGTPLDGLWSAPANGGKARLLMGTIQNWKLRVEGPFSDATTALLSPDDSTILLNPGDEIWVGSPYTGRGHFMSLHVSHGFVVSQIAWASAKELAFNRIRAIPRKASEWFLLKSSLFSLTTGHTKPVAHVVGPSQTSLEVAPPTKCTDCGA